LKDIDPKVADAKLPKDRFGTIAETKLNVPAGRWKVSTTSDDGVRVWMDDKLVIDNWTWHVPTVDSTEITIEPTGAGTGREGGVREPAEPAGVGSTAHRAVAHEPIRTPTAREGPGAGERIRTPTAREEPAGTSGAPPSAPVGPTSSQPGAGTPVEREGTPAGTEPGRYPPGREVRIRVEHFELDGYAILTLELSPAASDGN
jgi:hypothetical protein